MKLEMSQCFANNYGNRQTVVQWCGNNGDTSTSDSQWSAANVISVMLIFIPPTLHINSLILIEYRLNLPALFTLFKAAFLCNSSQADDICAQGTKQNWNQNTLIAEHITRIEYRLNPPARLTLLRFREIHPKVMTHMFHIKAKT